MLETRKLWKISTILAGFLFLVFLTWPLFFDASLISFYAYLLFLVIMLGVVKKGYAGPLIRKLVYYVDAETMENAG